MQSWITTPQVIQLLDSLYADADANDYLARQKPQEAGVGDDRGVAFFKAMRKAYMAIGRDFGHLLYSLVRTSRAKTVVEFGTSFGVSTIYLASAIRDNGGGRIITTEYEPEKAEQAKKNLTAAGLEEFVEFRIGDALQTLAVPPSDIDLIFLDGTKHLYLDVLRLLEPNLRSGGIVASDNTDHEGMESFLAYIRNPENGYTSAAIHTEGRRISGHEITVRS